jgi:putative transposase
MKERITKVVDKSRVVWENLEAWVREKIQGYVQDLLEEEVTALLGREKSERCQEIDAMGGYRNGHGKPRRLSLSCGTVELRRPRVRGLEARFESRILPLFVRRSEEVGALLPELYLHGLAMGDFELALRWLLGEGAPLSESSIARLKAKWQGEYDAWRRRSLADLEVVYLWADGVYVKAGLEKEKAALLVLVAGLSDGRKVVLGVESGYRESTESWSALLRDLRERGLRPPCLVIGDGHLGLWGALGQVYPESEEQRCWNHRIINILDKLPKKHHADAKRRLRQIAYAETREQAEKQKRSFQTLVQRAPFGGGRGLPGPRLGTDGELLPLPQGALDPPTHHQSHRIALRRGAATDRCGETLQAGRQCYDPYLEDLDDLREDLPSTQRT